MGNNTHLTILFINWLRCEPHRTVLQMSAEGELRVLVEPRGDKYIWELHRDGRFQPVKFSAPVYISEQAAMASGEEARTLYLARLAIGTKKRSVTTT